MGRQRIGGSRGNDGTFAAIATFLGVLPRAVTGCEVGRHAVFGLLLPVLLVAIPDRGSGQITLTVSGTSIVVTWSGPDNKDYALQYQANPSVTVPTDWASATTVWERTTGGGLVTASFSKTISGLTASTKYWIRYGSADQGGDITKVEDFSEGQAVTTGSGQTAVPGKVANVAGTYNYADRTLTITWDPRPDSEKVTRYVVLYNGTMTLTYPADSVSSVNQSASPSIGVGPLVLSRDYPYAIVAVSDTGAGELSDIFIARIPPAPGAVTISAGITGLDVILGWADTIRPDEERIIRYVVLRSSTEFPAYPRDSIAAVAIGVYEETLEMGDVYHYAVVAVNSTGAGPLSNVEQVTVSGTKTPTSEPAQPTLIGKLEGAEVQLDWEEGYAGGKADRYVILQSSKNKVPVYPADSIANVAATDPPQHNQTLPEGTHYFAVVGINAEGASIPSNVYEVSVKKGDDEKPGDTSESQVTNLRAVGERKQISLSWTAPTSSSFKGDSLKHYQVQSAEASASFTDLTTVTAPAYIHTDLADDVTRRYQVRAVNKRDSAGTWSSTASATTGKAAAEKPGAPTGLTATTAASGVTLNWTAPADTGSAAITGYRVEYSTDGGSAWVTLIQLNGAVIRTYVHADPPPGQTLHYRVFAINKHGASPSSNVAIVRTARLLPTAPRNLSGQANEASNSLTWQAPSDRGAGEFSGYRVEQSVDGGVGWTELARVVSTATGYIHRNPPRGATIHYRVIAMNDNGDSPPSNVISLMTTATAPTKPLGLSAYAEGSTVRLSWTEPRDDGGSAIASYRIEVSSGASNWRTVASTGSPETSYAHVGVDPGVTLHYRVFALNAVGESQSSNIARVDVDAVPPDPPSNVGAIATSATAIGLAWDPPGNTGGSPITAFRIEFSTDGAFWSILASNFTVASTAYRHTGLDPATRYYYRVFAINKAGRSAPSEVVNATTHADLPGIPERLLATAVSSTQIDLTWHEPSYTGGVPITGYEIETSSNGETWIPLTTTPDDATVFKHTGLTPATIYHYRVAAINRTGKGKLSRGVFAQTQAALPERPKELQATAQSHDEIYLAWKKPDYDGGSPIRGYLIETSTDAGSSWTTVRANTGSTNTVFAHTGLSRATVHHYRVAAINRVGTGDYSDVTEAKTFAVIPDAPRSLTAEPASSVQIDLDWRVPEDDGGAPITGYLIEMSADLIEWEELAEAQELTYQHTGVIPGETWNYRVYAKNEAGSSIASNIATATTDDPTQRTERVITAILPRFAATAMGSSLRVIAERVRAVAEDQADHHRINVMAGREGDLRAIADGSTGTQSLTGGISIWGSADLTGLSAGGTVESDGEVFSVHAGIDGMLRDGILVGFSGSRSKGSFSFTDRMGARDIEGTFDASLLSMNPYVAWIRKDVGVWAATGFGWGSIEISDPVNDRESNLATSMLAVGGFKELITSPIGAFHLRLEGSTGEVEVAGNVPRYLRIGAAPEHINEMTTRLGRGRALIDWTVPHQPYGEYRAEIRFQAGARYDYNDVDTGVSGAEFSSQLRFTGPCVPGVR